MNHNILSSVHLDGKFIINLYDLPLVIVIGSGLLYLIFDLTAILVY